MQVAVEKSDIFFKRIDRDEDGWKRKAKEGSGPWCTRTGRQAVNTVNSFLKMAVDKSIFFGNNSR